MKSSLLVCVSNGYTAAMKDTKDSGLRIRVERALRSEFLDACKAAHKPAAQVLREFMREYVGERQPHRKNSVAGGRSRKRV